MKRRRFIGFLATVPFIGPSLANAMAKRQRLIEEGSRLVRERMHEPTIELVLVEDDGRVMTELWADFPMKDYADQFIVYARKVVDKETGEERNVCESRHVWTKRLGQWARSKRCGRAILVRKPYGQHYPGYGERNNAPVVNP